MPANTTSKAPVKSSFFIMDEILSFKFISNKLRKYYQLKFRQKQNLDTIRYFRAGINNYNAFLDRYCHCSGAHLLAVGRLAQRLYLRAGGALCLPYRAVRTV